MPKGIDSCVRDGLLTTYVIERLTGMSVPKIRQLCENETIPSCRLPGSKERRIFAGPFVKWLIDQDIQPGPKLLEAAKNYEKKHGSDPDSFYRVPTVSTGNLNGIPQAARETLVGSKP